MTCTVRAWDPPRSPCLPQASLPPPSPIALRGRPCPLTSLCFLEGMATSSTACARAPRCTCMLAQACLQVCVALRVHLCPSGSLWALSTSLLLWRLLVQAGPKSLPHLHGPSSPVLQLRAGNSDPGPPRTQKPSPALTRRGSGLQRRTPV